MADKTAPKKFSLFKKSPFNAPTLPAAGDDDSDKDEDFFSRSNHTWALLAADSAERKKRQREESHQEKANATASLSTAKKLRSSPEVEDEEGAQNSRDGKPEDDTLRPASPPSALRHTSGSPSKKRTKSVVEIESDDDDVVITSFQEQASAPSTQPDPLLSDAQASRKRPLRAMASIATADSPPEDDEVLEIDPYASSPGPTDAVAPAIQLPQTQSQIDEPKVSVLITSAISGTTPLIVQRKLGQRLKEARLEWCHRQQFTPERTAEIVLTWRGKRVYDSTSCRTLGIGTNVDGNIVGEGEKDLFGIEDRRIHMEAMTEEMLTKAKQAKLNPRLARAEAEDAAAATQQGTEQPEEKQKPIRIILKSAGFEELKFIVKLTFRVSRLIDEFRQRNQVEEAQTVSIHFDGEQLSPESMIEDTEIDDMDTLDVYVR